MDIETNKMGEMIARVYNSTFLDSDKILWKLIDGEWIGKRSVYMKDLSCKWLEDIDVENIKSWWCGKESDYKQIFKRENGTNNT